MSEFDCARFLPEAGFDTALLTLVEYVVNSVAFPVRSMRPAYLFVVLFERYLADEILRPYFSNGF